MTNKIEIHEAFFHALQYPLNNKLKLMQNLNEMHWLFNLIVTRYPDARTYLEIGNLEGVSTYILSKALPIECQINMIDIKRIQTRIALIQKMRKQGHTVNQIIGDSSKAVTYSKLIEKLPPDYNMLDLLFIDGDHHLKAVRADFERYYPLVREGGMIALHDISPGIIQPQVGVPRYWKALKEKYPNHLECMNPKGRRGIGAIFK